MPELPDVQVFKEYLDATALHQPIRDVAVEAEGMLKVVSPRTLKERLRGAALVSTMRHGKHLFAEIEGDGWLRLHFGMTGELEYFKADGDEPDHVRLRLSFENDYHLVYRNTRKLGEIGLVDEVETFVAEAGLGPDALDPELDLVRLRRAFEGRRGTLKGALMNQEILAGIGNIYADEILLRAGLHPEARVDRLRDESLARLQRSMRTVLQAAIEARVDPERFPPSFLLPFREEGVKCPRCRGKIEKTQVSGRSTYYCPHHQRSKA